ncbi:MAG: ABC transporter permease [Intestinimonas sp.]|nr:ABC transporter permease [Intestinimonas sp.]
MGLFGKSKVQKLGDSLTERLKGNLDGAAMTQAELDALDPSLFALAEYDAAAAERSGYSNYSYWKSTCRVFWKNRAARFLLFLLAALLIFTFIQPYLPNQKDDITIYYDQSTDLPLKNKLPGEEPGFFLGTNSIGQDLWARIWSGTRTSLFIGFVVALSQCIIGVGIGVLWGYVRKVDKFFTELYNIINNVPRTIILILISYILRPSLSTIIIAMCFVGWVPMSLLIRNQIVIIRDRDYNLASRCLGSSSLRIMVKNLLPYLVSIIMLQMALAVPAAITDEVFLTYIGLGLPLDMPSLGTLIIAGRAIITSAKLQYQLLFPCLSLSLVTVCFYVIGNAFADAADPKNHVN